MDEVCSPAVSRKRRRRELQKNIGIEDLGDDCLIAILSCLSMKEAGRTSVLSGRWRYLWMSAYFGTTLEFYDRKESRDDKGRIYMSRSKFKRWVTNVLFNRRQPADRVNALIIRNRNMRRKFRGSLSVESWISFAIHKEVTRFELEFSPYIFYEFPFKLLWLHSVDTCPAFRLLQSLKFTSVNIEDRVIAYFFGSCPHLQHLSINWSYATKYVVFGDPLPNLKTLQIIKCCGLQSLELFAPNLVSFASDSTRISLALDKCFPSLSELTLDSYLASSFILKPHLHSSYSLGLVKLRLQIIELTSYRGASIVSRDWPPLCFLKRLELQTFSLVGRSLLFFTLLINETPLLQEFKFEIRYEIYPFLDVVEGFPYPDIRSMVEIVHENLKMVEMVGYIGCSSDDEFLCHLFKIAPTLERVVIDTHSDYYDEIGEALIEKEIREETRIEWDDWPQVGAQTKTESMDRAANFIKSYNQQIINFLIK